MYIFIFVVACCCLDCSFDITWLHQKILLQKIYFTESQNYRMSEVARNTWRFSSPTPLLKQSQREQVTQGRVQTGF